MLAFKDSRVIPRLVILRLENVDKMPKLTPRIKLSISFDLGRTVYPEFIKPDVNGYHSVTTMC